MLKQVLFISMLAYFTACGQNKASDQNSTASVNDLGDTKGVSFKVDDVKIADSLLKTDTAKLVFENKIAKEILFFPEEQSNIQVVSCANNGLIQTIQECYDNHRPLVLTPDVIWLTICQGVSIHINQHYDSLKDIIFIKDKQDKIEVRNDSLEYSAKQWKSLIASFANETKKYTKGDLYSFFVPEFTTTTAINKTAYQITLLESYKKAFEYVGASGCGIPSIRITGTKNDWQSILSRLELLGKLGLSEWAKNLKPIILEFISASEGKQNTEFWKSIYKSASEYNGFYISGWIIKFFPYIKELEYRSGVYDEKTGEMRVGEVFLPNEFIDGDQYLLSTLSTDNFPSGIAKVPVTWKNYFKNITKQIEVYAGFFAIKQYADKSLEPLISWAICEESAKAPNHILSENINLNVKHSSDYWSPHFVKYLTDSAIYDIKNFKTQYSSVTYLRTLILDSLSKNTKFKRSDYLKDTIKIEVLSNGKTGGVSLVKSTNSALTAYISGLIARLPEKWFPALAHPMDVLFLMELPEEDKDIKVRANSIVTIVL